MTLGVDTTSIYKHTDNNPEYAYSKLKKKLNFIWDFNV